MSSLNLSFYDDARVSEPKIKRNLTRLQAYRTTLRDIETTADISRPESALFAAKDSDLHETIDALKKRFKSVKALVLIGIGGSSLGFEAVYSVAGAGKRAVHVIDDISVSKLEAVKLALKPYRKVEDIVVCVASKSGTTTETISNASVFLAEMIDKYGVKFYQQVVWISDQQSPLYKYGKKQGGQCVPIPNAVGGRYSVGTAVALVPLALAGVDTEEYIAGFLDASSSTLESVAAESAARLALYHEMKYVHYNFFAFESRLDKLAAWYQQLLAESLGKSERSDGSPMPYALVPTLSTPTELHSVGQLYFSRITSVYTDFVSFDDAALDVFLPKRDRLAGKLAKYSMQEIATALYGGVIAAYQERQLPYRATILDDNLPYALGVFMAMRMREIMYTAELLKVNAFNQPNVELYKEKTKSILSL